MATYQKRCKRWRAIIRRKGHPTVVKSFERKPKAEAWARAVESRLDRGVVYDVQGASRVTMATLFARYEDATRETKRNAPTERFALELLNKEFGHLKLSELRPQDIAEFRDRRLMTRKPATVTNNLHLLSAVIQMATTEWGFEIPYNPARRVKKPKARNARDRRLAPGEEQRLLAAADELGDPELKALVTLGVTTAMRIGEMLSLTWENIRWERRQAFLPETKNGEERRVPLSKRATAALQSLGPKETGKVITKWKNSHSFVRPWQKLTRQAGITGLRFHDLRHEAASRMAEKGMSILMISAVTGHKSFQMLKRYTHVSTETLAAELDKIE